MSYVWTAVKILIACFVVGLILSWIDFDAIDVLRSVSQLLRDTVAFIGDLLPDALQYILLGAVVVVPIVLIRWAIRLTKRRPSQSSDHHQSGS